MVSSGGLGDCQIVVFASVFTSVFVCFPAEFGSELVMLLLCLFVRVKGTEKNQEKKVDKSFPICAVVETFQE